MVVNLCWSFKTRIFDVHKNVNVLLENMTKVRPRALQIHLRQMRIFCLNVTIECSIGHTSTS